MLDMLSEKERLQAAIWRRIADIDRATRAMRRMLAKSDAERMAADVEAALLAEPEKIKRVRGRALHLRRALAIKVRHEHHRIELAHRLCEDSTRALIALIERLHQIEEREHAARASTEDRAQLFTVVLDHEDHDAKH
jgi:hypothetical protein